jgi:hypothetical protein
MNLERRGAKSPEARRVTQTTTKDSYLFSIFTLFTYLRSNPQSVKVNCPQSHRLLSSSHTHRHLHTAKMIPRRARGTIQCLHQQARRLSTTTPAAAIAPHRKAAATSPSNPTQPAEASKRSQSTSTATATTQDRARPSPAFNREDPKKDVQPLRPYKGPELDFSFVGMTGGEIIHEMLLRQNVKHVCESLSP